MNIIVVDNFYKNPQHVRGLALKAQYKDVTQLNYPGFQSVHNYSTCSVIQKIEKTINSKIVLDSENHTFGKFRIMFKETGSNLKVHLDGQADWTGVLYLNPAENCHGGTGFYAHKLTGLDGPTHNLDWHQIEKDIIEPDTLNQQAWIQTDFIAMKFNRLVLFRGNKLFHCHTESFGTNLQNGRLTQNFFFHEEKNV